MGFRQPLTRLSELVGDIITGAVYRTRASGARLEINTDPKNSSSIRFYGANDVPGQAFPAPASVRLDRQDPAATGYGYGYLTTRGPIDSSGTAAFVAVGEALSDYGATRVPTIELNAAELTITGDGYSGTTGLQILGDTDWVDLVMANGWLPHPAGAPPGWRVLNGVLYLRGIVYGGATGYHCAAIPPPYVPPYSREFIVRSTAAAGWGGVTVRGGDGVIFNQVNGVGGGSGAYYLDDVNYALD